MEICCGLQADSLLLSLERAVGSIGLHANANKTEYMCFNERDDISTLNDRFLKLVDKFTYLGSNVSSTENDINTWLAKAWTAFDRLSVIWKSDLPDKIKCTFFPSSGRVNITKWIHHMDFKRMEKKFDDNYTRMHRIVLNWSWK